MVNTDLAMNMMGATFMFHFLRELNAHNVERVWYRIQSLNQNHCRASSYLRIVYQVHAIAKYVIGIGRQSVSRGRGRQISDTYLPKTGRSYSRTRPHLKVLKV